MPQVLRQMKNQMNHFLSLENKRKRKNSAQINVLLEHFSNNPEWSRPAIQNAANEAGLSYSQAYKWGWDRKNKSDLSENFNKPSKDEFGGYSKHYFTNQGDPIAQVIGKNLDVEVEKLFNNQTPSRGEEKSVMMEKTPKNKKERKLTEKVRGEYTESPRILPSKLCQPISLYQDCAAVVRRETQMQTPNLLEPQEEDLVTLTKPIRDSECGTVQVTNNLFLDTSANFRDSKIISERKLDSSEHSFKKKSSSDVNSSRIKCSEDLELNKENPPRSQVDMIESPKKEISSFQHPVMLKEIEIMKPFCNLRKNLSRTPEQITPPEESLLGPDYEEINCRHTINLTLIEFEIVSEPPSHHLKAICRPFQLEERGGRIEEEKNQEVLSKERYPSFPDLLSNDSEIEKKLDLGEGFDI
ncbi:unnamed protein product [Moneuplotes crassus]|uniref:Uncharacterized protein n=1 Tax=Euplotes crassus TaxID=5936 RepID=A0AAD1U0B9_EUPCR|nr:unnamed protein product [Moneuplotes crassus]